MATMNRFIRNLRLLHIGFLALVVVLLTGCNQHDYNMQANVDTLGDAMSHCRGYTRFMLPDEARMSLDELSSRETPEYYDIFFDVSDASESGHAKCRVDKTGLIIFYQTYGYRQRSRSFADF